MLKITPYMGPLVIIVSIAGLWYPLLGYFMLLVFGAIFLIAPFRGRWFCGNLCPRGSFMDFWVGKVSEKRKIPFFRYGAKKLIKLAISRAERNDITK